jgi:transcriptional regulator of acetoin/glycerol metabolism
VRAEIVASWRRAMYRHLRPEVTVPRYDDLRVTSPSLLDAADSVLTALGDDIAATNTVVALADHRGQIMRRYGPGPAARWLDRLGLAPGFVWSEDVLGTNAVGMALEAHGSVLVTGDEHFADTLTGASSGAAPVVWMDSGQLVGVVAVVRPADEASDLMLAMARQAARDITNRLRTTSRHRSQGRSRHERFGWDSLTQTERLVADLATRGQTNREIGEALVISPHTVDSHIRHIYAKLGISSRVELTRLVLAGGDDGRRRDAAADLDRCP